MTALAHSPGPAAVLRPVPLQSLLKVEGLRVSFRRDDGWREVVSGISFEIGDGETLAIIGESGSGKSVTASAIMRLLPTGMAKVEGSIAFGGLQLANLSERRMRQVRGNNIAMVFQEPMTSLNPVATIGRQIGETLQIHRGLTGRGARVETLRLLDRVRIADGSGKIDAYPHQLSGGQRQRVMIAMALACRPKLLIADEPTTALDVTIQDEILKLIRDLQADDQMGVLFITHDMGVVTQMADRVAVMKNGIVVESGETEEILRDPSTPIPGGYCVAVPRLGLVDAERSR